MANRAGVYIGAVKDTPTRQALKALRAIVERNDATLSTISREGGAVEPFASNVRIKRSDRAPTNLDLLDWDLWIYENPPNAGVFYVNMLLSSGLRDWVEINRGP